MKHLVCVITLIVFCLGLVGCGDERDGDGLSTSTSALTEAEAEALRECLGEIEACRETVASEDEFLAECKDLLQCLPERSDAARANGDEWRAFCEGVEERCHDGETDAATCDELRLRCVDGIEAPEVEVVVSPEECLEDCLTKAPAEDCAERCASL